MKPTVTLDGKTGVPVVQQQVPTEVSPKSKWLKYAGLCLLLILLTTVTVFVVMTYNNTKASGQKVDTDVTVNIKGAKTTKQSDVKATITSHIVPNAEDIKEDIVISDQEEDISAPKARVIYDYASGYAVTKFKDSEDEICYVSEFNIIGGIDGIRNSLEKEGNETYVYTNSTEAVYETTGETVNKTLLSPRAAEMCKNSEVLRVVRVADDSSKRVERAACFSYRYIICSFWTSTRTDKSCSGRWFRRRCKYRFVFVRRYWACKPFYYRRCVWG